MPSRNLQLTTQIFINVCLKPQKPKHIKTLTSRDILSKNLKSQIGRNAYGVQKSEEEVNPAAGRTGKWPLEQVGRIRDKRGGRRKTK